MQNLGPRLLNRALNRNLLDKGGAVGVFASAPLDLRFALQKTLDPRVTFTRASSATFVDSSGVLRSATTNEPRFDHNPTTGESFGLLVEEARTNLLLNSATLSTQSVTVAAAANTLSFYGTGTVTLTGVSTAGPLVGTGANNRVSLTFTPTAGSLTLTVSGSVTNAQLEAGSFATSYIPTTSATVTRAADVASITGANFSSFYNQTEGTVFVDINSAPVATVIQTAYDINDGTTNERIFTRRLAAGTIGAAITDGNVVQANIGGFAIAASARYRSSLAYKLNDFSGSVNGATNATASSGTLPTVTAMNIGATQAGASQANGTIRRLAYWPTRLANTTLQQITQP